MGGCCEKSKLGNEMSLANKEPLFIHSVAKFTAETTINNTLMKCQPEKSETEKYLLAMLKENIDIIKSNNSTYNIELITLEEIWNISKFFLNDFTLSNYLLLDLRPKKYKTENFLKKYKSIDYSIDNIRNFEQEKIEKFNKYLLNKKVLIIPDIENIEIISNFLNVLKDKNINQFKIYILKNILNPDIMTNYYDIELYKALDNDNFQYYPDILCILKYVSYLNNSNFLFIDKLSNSCFNKNQLTSSNKNDNDDYFNFLHIFHIKLIISLQLYEEDICDISSINKNNTDLIYIILSYKHCDNEYTLINIINLIKKYILDDNGVIFLYDDRNVSNDLVFKFLAFIFLKIFYCDLSYNNLFDMINGILSKSNLLCFHNDFTNNFKNYLLTINNFINNRKYAFIKNEKIEYLNKTVLNLYNDLKKEKSEFLNVISIIERILLNILINTGNSKYYRVKKDSNTFKNNILFNKNSLDIFLFFSFQSTSEDYFYLDINTDMNIFQEKFDLLNSAINKVLNIDSNNNINK